MTLKLLYTPAVSVLSTVLLASSALAQSHPAAPESPYGGVVVEDIVARVNDQIITRSDYDRALKELDDEGRQHGATMQQLSEAHKDLLRNLIDQQLWLSKGKELGVTGETELINRLNEIRKQYNLSTLEDLEKAAQQQGVSFEDFKANIRNQIVTQQVMRDEVGRRVSLTPGEAQRYFESHKQEYAQPESVRLSEILISTGAAGGTAGAEMTPDDPSKVAAAQAKAEEVEAKLKAGADFAQLAKSSSEGPNAADGGDIGQFKRGVMNKILEDATFSLQSGDITQPIRTKQGFVIFKITQHVPGGVPQYKDVEQEVEQAYYESKMAPAVREYLTKMREDAYVEIKPGYDDTGASPNKRVVPISYSTYTPPAPKKKKKVERTRFRETTHTFRQKSGTPAPLPASAAAPAASAPTAAEAKNNAAQASMKPGKKEKIRFGKAPTKTLPAGPETPTEDAGGGEAQVAQSNEPANPLESNPAPEKKTRFSDRAREVKQNKVKGAKKVDPLDPKAPDASEVADRQTQSAPLGLKGDTASKKKKKSSTTTTEKTRYSEKKTDDQKDAQPAQPTPIPAVPGAPAPAATPSTQPQQ